MDEHSDVKSLKPEYWNENRVMELRLFSTELFVTFRGNGKSSKLSFVRFPRSLKSSSFFSLQIRLLDCKKFACSICHNCGPNSVSAPASESVDRSIDQSLMLSQHSNKATGI